MAIVKVKEIIKDSPDFTQLTDLAAEKLGGKVVFATDDFFAEKENLIKSGRGIFITDKYTERGKWMDGWESRRKRTSGNDWAVVKLATSGKITGFDIDTNFFLGNHPPHASIEAVNLKSDEGIADWNKPSIQWKEILPKSSLDAGSQNFYTSHSDENFTHIRLHIYPDGGVARLRVYGEVFKNWDDVKDEEEIDLLAAINGGNALACNDMFFSAMSNLTMPNRGANMGDGWETKRNRIPNNRDWVILKLATPGIIKSILVDTCHFKGNYPDSCMIEACFSDNDEDVINEKLNWVELLPNQKLSADHEHVYQKEITSSAVYSHVRLNIYPDGGISRLRLFGNKNSF
jgi:allantoicase